MNIRIVFPRNRVFCFKILSDYIVYDAYLMIKEQFKLCTNSFTLLWDYLEIHKSHKLEKYDENKGNIIAIPGSGFEWEKLTKYNEQTQYISISKRFGDFFPNGLICDNFKLAVQKSKGNFFIFREWVHYYPIPPKLSELIDSNEFYDLFKPFYYLMFFEEIEDTLADLEQLFSAYYPNNEGPNIKLACYQLQLGLLKMEEGVRILRNKLKNTDCPGSIFSVKLPLKNGS